jgi:hypothetical protein
MKVLVATMNTQGKRRNDFGYASPGELVRFGSECDGEAVDGKCGCRRALVGMDSGKATTTFIVVDIPITQAYLQERVKKSLQDGGWLSVMTQEEGDKWAKDEAKDLTEIAEFFEERTIVEKRGGKFQSRGILKVESKPWEDTKTAISQKYIQPIGGGEPCQTGATTQS